MIQILILGGFQAGWLSCVLGAAHGVPLAGVGVVTVLFAAHLAFGSNAGEDLCRGVMALALGAAADFAVASSGAIAFPPHAQVGWSIPLWMSALWLNLALTLRSPLAWLQGRPLVAGSLGAAGGPLSYFGGSRLGALEMAPWGAWAVGLEWLVAMPLLVSLSGWCGSWFELEKNGCR